MKCKNCGAEIADNAFFCDLCGEVANGYECGQRIKVDLSKPGDTMTEQETSDYSDDSELTINVFDYSPAFEFDKAESVPISPESPEKPKVIEIHSDEEPQIVNRRTEVEPSAVNEWPDEEPQIVASEPEDEPQIIRVKPRNQQGHDGLRRASHKISIFDSEPTDITPQANAPMSSSPGVAPKPTVPKQPTLPHPEPQQYTIGPKQERQPQRAALQPDINALRNNVIAGFSYRHHDTSDYFGKVEGENKSFAFFGKELKIPPEKDAFNAYRLEFRDLAIKYSNKFIREYSLLVINLDTFMRFFSAIYLSNMEYMINAAMDVLAGESVWTQTFDSFYRHHAANYHEGMDTYYLTVRNIDLALRNNYPHMQRMPGYPAGVVPGFMGTGNFSVSESMASAMNYRSNIIIQNAVKAARISHPQKAEIFSRIVPSVLFHKVYMDYWRVFMSVVAQLRKSGKNIWMGTKEMAIQTDNMLRYLTNPRFPKEKTQELLLQMLELYPYSKPLFYQMTKLSGKTEEIAAIRQYFGYSDLGNSRII